MAAASIEVATATVVHADTAPAPVPVHYHASVDGTDIVATLDQGSFTDSGDGRAVTVRDAAAQPLDAIPLSYTLADVAHAIRHEISADGRTLRLTPDTSGVEATTLESIASPVENQLAMNDLINSVSIGTSLGSLVGTVIGATAGIGVGFAVAGASCLVLSLGCVVAVLPVVALVGGIGGIAGLAVGGGPIAAYSLYQYMQTLQAPPGTSQYGDYYNNRRQQTSAADESR
ncbi:hypothetical protein EBN03_31250 [Nocardia stercoris]|uniref:DUF8020 domain-containing protein n=2 Tax=Nocardia stercoris TaxID=2483361 RepID=A0A3M2KR99_9NOCA|nr:hypothetical protein EBN03_31250 [Nocardia stercoris]